MAEPSMQHIILKQYPKINLLYLFNEELNIEILFANNLNQNHATLVCGFIRNITTNAQIKEISHIISVYSEFIVTKYELNIRKQSLNDNEDCNALNVTASKIATQYFDAQDMNITNCTFNVESLFVSAESENKERDHRLSDRHRVGSHRLNFSIRARALFVCNNVCSEYCEWMQIETVNKHGWDYLTCCEVIPNYDHKQQFRDYWKQSTNTSDVNMCEWLLLWKEFGKLNGYELKRCYYYLSKGSNKNISVARSELFVNEYPGGGDNVDKHDKRMKSDEWERMRSKMRSCFPEINKYKLGSDGEYIDIEESYSSLSDTDDENVQPHNHNDDQ